MKNLVVLIYIVLLHTCNAKSQEDIKKETLKQTGQVTDTLVLKKYIGGDPFMDKINTETKLAKQWGFKIQYTFGDCGGTNDYLIKKFEAHNEKTNLALTKKFGKNWEVTFQNQVVLSTHPWFFNIQNLDDFRKLDTLKLSTKESKVSFHFNLDNTYMLTNATQNTKEVIKSYYRLSINQLQLTFPNGEHQDYNLRIISPNEISLTLFK